MPESRPPYPAFLDDIDDLRLRHAKWQARTSLYRMVENPACRHAAILAHFGEALEPCRSSCDVCTGVTVESLAAAGARHDRAGRSRAPAVGRTSPGSRAQAEAEALFDRLRTLRKRLADDAGVPAYVVFNDSTLRAMAESRPASESALLALPGVGPVKLERYGAAFLAACHDR